MKKIFSLENLVYLIILFLPAYLIKVNIFFVPTNILEIMIVGLFVCWLFSKKEKVDLRESWHHYRGYYFSLGLILLGLVVSAVLSGSSSASWGIIKGWFIFPIIFLGLVWEIIEKEKIEKVFGTYVFSATGVALIAFLYLFFSQMTYDGRLLAFFNSPNYLAMYLAPAIIIIGEQIQSLKNKNWRFLSLAIIIPIFYLTYSYMAWIAVLLVSFILLLIKNKHHLKYLIILTIIAIMLFFSQLNNQKLKNLLIISPRSSLASRSMIWKASFRMIENNFWLGIGAGNFQKTYLEYQKFYPPYLEWAVPHPHNLYLSFWLSSGIFGLAGFLSLILLFLRDILDRIRKKTTKTLFMALGIMLVILIHGIFDTTYFKNDLAIVFWLSFLVLKSR